MEPLDAREITYGDTTFYFGKLLPMEAKRVFMRHVRPLLRGALSANVDDDGSQWKMLLAAFTDAPQEHYDTLVNVLYRLVEFTKNGQANKKPLLGDEEFAFENLDMVHMISVDVRAFAVNFFESWAVLKSEYPHLSKALQQQSSAT